MTSGHGSTPPVSPATRVFEAELAAQRITPEHLAPTTAVTDVTRGASSDGFVTVEAARTLTASALVELARSARGRDSEHALWAAHEIAPDKHPAPTGCPGCGDTRDRHRQWACCTSGIGPTCGHKLPPPDDLTVLDAKHDEHGRWVRRDADGDVLETLPPSHMAAWIRRGPPREFARIPTITDDTVTVERPRPSSVDTHHADPRRTTLTYRWEPFAEGGPGGAAVST
jgi:hypothetical protein